MIIGSGFLAKNLRYHNIDVLPLVVLASGVGNSNCDSVQEFERETGLLIEKIELAKDLDWPVIYFSTIANEKLPYAQHKKNCEKIIYQSGVRHCIIRCPQLIGHFLNNYHLVGYFRYQILKHLKFQVFENAERNILDVECLADFIKLWADNPKYSTVNLGGEKNIRVLELVALIEQQVKVEANYERVNSLLPVYSVEQDPSWEELKKFGLDKQVPYKELIAKYL